MFGWVLNLRLYVLSSYLMSHQLVQHANLTKVIFFGQQLSNTTNRCEIIENYSSSFFREMKFSVYLFALFYYCT